MTVAQDIQQVRIQLESTTDYDAIKSVAYRSLAMLEDALTQLERIRNARHADGPNVRYEEDTVDKILEIGKFDCPNGCGCRRGTNDPDRRDCACDGPCTMDQTW